MNHRQLKLTITQTQFVSCEEDIEQAPRCKTLVLSANVYSKIVALAETTGYKLRSHHFLPGQTSEFAKALRQAAKQLPVPVTLSRANRFTTENQVREFFVAAANQRTLSRVLALLESGGVLEVEDA